MCGSKPKDPGPSSQEIALASISAADYQRWAAKGAPLEAFAVEESMDPNVLRARQSLLGGRASADVAQAEVGAQHLARKAALRSGQGLRSSSNMLPMTDTSAAAQTGAAQAKVSGAIQGRNIQDAQRINSLQSGAKQAGNMYSGLASAARRGNSRVMTSFANKQRENAARAQAFGDIANAGLQIGMKKWDDRKQKNYTEESEASSYEGSYEYDGDGFLPATTVYDNSQRYA